MIDDLGGSELPPPLFILDPPSRPLLLLRGIRDQEVESVASLRLLAVRPQHSSRDAPRLPRPLNRAPRGG